MFQNFRQKEQNSELMNNNVKKLIKLFSFQTRIIHIEVNSPLKVELKRMLTLIS